MRMTLACCIAVLCASPCLSAELGNQFDSYRDLHSQTAYGSLFFNRGAINYHQNRSRKNFIAIKGSGMLDLPQQQGYCFVFNHYTDDPDRQGKTGITYTATISKTFSDGRRTVEKVPRQFDPADWVTSPNLPDHCISGLNMVTQVDVAFAADADDAFNWSVWFKPK